MELSAACVIKERKGQELKGGRKHGVTLEQESKKDRKKKRQETNKQTCKTRNKKTC